MPLIHIDQFAAQLSDKKNKSYDIYNERTLVQYGGGQMHFFNPISYKFITDGFSMSAMNEYEHRFQVVIKRDTPLDEVQVTFSQFNEPVLSLYGTVHEFINEELKVIHHGGMRVNGVKSDLTYASNGNLAVVLEEISLHKRINNKSFKASVFVTFDTPTLVKSLVSAVRNLI